jgi:hypothetical protein
MKTLRLQIVLDDGGAIQKLKDFDAVVDKTTARAPAAATAQTQVASAVKNVGSAHAEAATSMDQFAALADRVIERMVVYASVRGVLSAIEGTINYARELRNLSLETGISVEQIQRIANVTERFGVSADEVARLTFQLSRRIAGGDESAAAALHTMGLTVEEVRKTKPDELLLLASDGFAKMTDQQQKSAIASDLFGAKLGSALLATAGHLREATSEADRFGAVMNPEVVDANAKFQDSIDSLGDRLRGFGATVLAPILVQLEHYIELAARVPSSLTPAPTTSQYLPDYIQSLNPAGPTDLGRFQIQVDAFTKAMMVAKPFIDDLAKPLDDVQTKFLEILFDVGQLTAKNAAALDVTGAQVDVFKRKEETLIQTQANLANQMREMRDLGTELGTRYGKTLDELNAKEEKHLELLTAHRVELMLQGAADLEALNRRGLATTAEDAFTVALKKREEAERRIAVLEAQTPGVTVNGVNVFDAARAKAYSDFDDALFKTTAAQKGLGDAVTGTAAALGTVPGALTPATRGMFDFSFAIQGATEDLSALYQMLAQHNSVGVPNVFGGDTSSLFTRSYNPASGIFAGRAGGGDVTPGSSYWVGERGPEMFSPTSSGSIQPAGGVTNIYVDAKGSTFEDDRALDRLTNKIAVRMGQIAGRQARF